MPENVNTSSLAAAVEDLSEDNRRTMVKVDHVSMIFNMASEQLNSLKEYAIQIARRKLFFEGFTALDDVSFEVKKGDVFGIIGTNGSGKSTMLHMLGGLDRPTSGTVTVDGRELSTLKDEELTIFRRRKIGFVFQAYNLVPVLSVYENIVLPIQLDGGAVDESYVREVIAVLGLEKKLDSLPGQLSGGQQQRGGLAPGLAAKPAILLADEPTGNLDSRTSQDVLGLMKVTGQKFAQTMVMITHNEEIAQLADRIVRIEDGRIVTR